jgi:hypothetical protein
VGVLARVLEAAGLSTTSISMVREHTEKVKPPRALFVPFPLGRPLGAPNDPALQTRVVRAALDLLDAHSGPVLVDFPDEADPYTGQDLNLPQASSVAVSPRASTDVAFEVTSLRPYYEQFVQAHGGRTTVGLSGMDQRRFRGGVRFLEAFAAGEDAEVAERPGDVAVPQYVRWLADDLKAFYLEARTAQRPDDTFQQLNTWLWSETALANLLRSVAGRMQSSGDRALAALAFGIAR